MLGFAAGLTMAEEVDCEEVGLVGEGWVGELGGVERAGCHEGVEENESWLCGIEMGVGGLVGDGYAVEVWHVGRLDGHGAGLVWKSQSMEEARRSTQYVDCTFSKLDLVILFCCSRKVEHPAVTTFKTQWSCPRAEVDCQF